MKRDADYESLSIDAAAASSEVAPSFALVAWTIAAAVGWVVAWYWPTAVEVARIWSRSDTYAHGLTVLPIFAWLVWRSRDRLAVLRPQPLPWLALAVAGAGFLWMLGKLVGVAAASHFALVVTVALVVVGVLGWRLARALSFPLAFLAFAVPVGDFMLPTLMEFTADFVVGALRLSGVPVFQEGLFFVVPNGRWSVVEACSGIRYLIASLMIGSLYAYLNYSSLRKRLLFMVVALLLPIVANWLRAYMIVMLGYLSNNRIAAGVDHLIYGWIFFGVIIFLMFRIGARWRADEPARGAVAPAPETRRTNWAKALPVVLVVAAFPLAHAVLERPVEDYAVRLELPAPAPEWGTLPSDRLGYRPRYANARGEAIALYSAPDGASLGVFAAWYADQRDGQEMIGWGNGFAGLGDRAPVRAVRHFYAETPAGPVQAADIDTPEGRIRAWRWYRVNGTQVSSDAEVKLRLALNKVLGRPDESSVVVVFTRVVDGGERADKRLRDFIRAHGPHLDVAVDAPFREAQ